MNEEGRKHVHALRSINIHNVQQNRAVASPKERKLFTMNNNRINVGDREDLVVFELNLDVKAEPEEDIDVEGDEENSTVQVEIKEEILEDEIDIDEPEIDFENFKKELEDKNESSSDDKGPTKAHACTFCKMSFDYPSALKRHLVKHTAEKNFNCHICEKKFGSNTHRMRHYRGVHKTEPPKTPPKPKPTCPHCQETFSNKGYLSRHVMHKHTKEKNHECGICNLRFYNNSHLVRHERTHASTPDMQFTCSFCSRKFLEKFNLEAHERIHRGELPFECKVCGKSFRASNTLRAHERIHTGEKRYKCEECPMRFIASSSLRRHRLTHTGERPEACTICDKRFRTKAHVRRHIKALSCM